MSDTKTIRREDLQQVIEMHIRLGWACPRCKLEAWATATAKKPVEEGWCYSCAYSGEKPLKIV